MRADCVHVGNAIEDILAAVASTNLFRGSPPMCDGISVLDEFFDAANVLQSREDGLADSEYLPDSA
jgi:hypothetical protein